MAGQAERNRVHEEQLWTQRLDKEVEVAEQWWENWGFLAERPEPPARGFSTSTAKYAVKDDGRNAGLTVSKVRVTDDSAEGLAAAMSEIEQRKKRAALTWQTPFPGPMKPVGIAKGPYKGMELVGEDLEIHTREQAMLLRAHNMQSLGDACRTQGVDPHHKFKAPVIDSHEYGWRVPTKTNGRPNLEMFGVGHYGKKGMTWT
tara:strand:+ start:168 stop:773 length:606 start_codon:yes stop_codon:yes gene_type:complete